MRVALGTGPRDIIGRQRMPLPADHAADEGMDRASRLLLDLVEKAGKTMADVRAVGVGIPAPVDAVSGQVGSESILPGWRGVAVAKPRCRGGSRLPWLWTTPPTWRPSAS